MRERRALGSVRHAQGQRRGAAQLMRCARRHFERACVQLRRLLRTSQGEGAFEQAEVVRRARPDQARGALAASAACSLAAARGRFPQGVASAWCAPRRGPLAQRSPPRCFPPVRRRGREAPTSPTPVRSWRPRRAAMRIAGPWRPLAARLLGPAARACPAKAHQAPRRGAGARAGDGRQRRSATSCSDSLLAEVGFGVCSWEAADAAHEPTPLREALDAARWRVRGRRSRAQAKGTLLGHSRLLIKRKG